MTPFETMQTYYQQRDLAAKEWKKKGGKVVGYFCDNVPEELISAANFFPLRISGDPWGSTDIANKYRFYPVPHVEFVDSMLNDILTGQYDFLDYLVIPHARDQIYRLWQMLYHIQRINPNFKIPETYYLDNL